jgi:hypothetical protein
MNGNLCALAIRVFKLLICRVLRFFSEILDFSRAKSYPETADFYATGRGENHQNFGRICFFTHQSCIIVHGFIF